ncbi:InlB B-repeat-containing protein [Bifidobacterium biavatii]|uniref:KxYKxGKxW signal peptide n=1 Tax=Bifidobacterium biavatii DSM 23969 TaxID=1437608 RepID=A0A086ZN17_9BIFI|nr:InlB B-repeat-containing protein [Bifidobacterium biavatii]KFI47917.1 KxYKxGKxW signal peptide [Bifidobacterium biavatii DSM 23969]
MTGNAKVWRAPLAGLASVAMIATMGVTAMTASAATSSSFVPASQTSYTVVLNSGVASFNKEAALGLDTTLGAGNDDASLSSDSKTLTIKNVPAGKTVAEVENAAEATMTAPTGYVFTAGDFKFWFDGATYGTSNMVDESLTVAKASNGGQVSLYAHVPTTNGIANINFAGYSDPVKIPSSDKLATWQVPTTSNGQHVKAWLRDGDANKALDLKTTYTGDANYSAQWYDQTDPVVTYKNANGSTTLPADKTQNVAPGTAFDLLSASELGITGENVAVAYYSKADKSAQFTANKTGVTSDTVVYVASTTRKTVTYKYKTATAKDDGTYEVSAYVDYGTDTIAQNQNALEPPAPATRADGAKFLGWYTNSDLKTKVVFPYAFTGSATLYAKYGDATAKKNVKVTFDQHYNGAPAATSVTYKEGDKVAKPATPTRKGYVFQYWYANGADDKDVFKDDDLKATANVTYFAKWATEGEDAYNKISTKLSNADKQFTNASYKAYEKVYDEYINASDKSVKEGKTQADATKAVKAAKEALVENTVKLYRVYNPNNGDHFFTTNASIQSSLVNLGWKAEGAPFKVAKPYADKDGNYLNLGELIYSAYNPNTGEHLLVAKGEAEGLAKAGWTNEGVIFAVAQGSSSKSVYRVYNPNTNGPAHVYVGKAEGASLVKLGWKWDNNAKPVYKLG